MIKEIVQELEQAVKDRQLIRDISATLDCEEADILSTIDKIKDQAPASNPEYIKDEIRAIKDLADDISHEYSGVFDEMQSARDSLDYISSELDSMYSLESRLDDLMAGLDKEEKVEEATEDTPPVSEMGESVSATKQDNLQQ